MAEQHTPSEQPPSRSDAQFPEEQRRAVADDEISLIDLWLVLVRRRWVLGAVFAATTLAGGGYAALAGNKERYVTPIEIGRYLDEEGNLHALESSKELSSRLERSILPALRYEQESQEADREDENSYQEPPGIEVSTPEDLEPPYQVVMLTSEVPQEERGRVESLHQRVLERIQDIQSERLQAERARFENNLENQRLTLEETRQERIQEHQKIEHAIASAQDQLEELEATEQRLGQRLSRLEDRRAFLERQETFLADLLKDWRGINPSGSDSGGQAESLAPWMMISGGARAAELYPQLIETREELALGLEETRSNLEEKLTQNTVAQAEVKRQIERKKSELERLDQRYERKLQRQRNEIEAQEARGRYFQRTDAAVIATASAGGSKSAMIAALSAVLGIMLGIFSAFISEFHSRAKKVMQERSES